jgi:ribosome-associated toxin RatA of RatAB toxin-antitoxin module
MPEHAEHTITVAAPADAVHALIADVTNWPRIFPPTVHAEVLEQGDGHERIRIWATANDTVKTWTSMRQLSEGRIVFRQEISSPPVASMGGEWILEAQPDGSTLVRLLHDFTAVGDDPASIEWISQAIDRNSDKELAALRDAAVAGDEHLTLRVEDTVDIGGPAEDVYGFLYQAQLWEQRLPHVARVELVEDTPNLQSLEMDTRAPNGSIHTTRSIRVCTPHTRIVYKQLRLPALLSVHIGQWSLAPTPGGVRVTSGHTVVLKPSAIPDVLGAEATVGNAREFVRNALSTNSLATLNLAKEFSERGSAQLSR